MVLDMTKKNITFVLSKAKTITNKLNIMGFLQEFKTFALKGNVVDMAVGVIIGGAFGKSCLLSVIYWAVRTSRIWP